MSIPPIAARTGAITPSTRYIHDEQRDGVLLREEPPSSAAIKAIIDKFEQPALLLIPSDPRDKEGAAILKEEIKIKPSLSTPEIIKRMMAKVEKNLKPKF